MATPALCSPRRTSAFFEVGLGGDDAIIDDKLRKCRPGLQVRFRSNVSVIDAACTASDTNTRLDGQVSPSRPTRPTISSRLPMMLIVVVLALLAQQLHVPLPQLINAPITVEAGPVAANRDQNQLAKRQSSSTDVCKRWGGQSALVNGTLFYYGGHATSSSDQTSDTWNNNFISLDLTKTWQISSPAFQELPTPSGPPAIALGQLWSSTDDLFLYGGQFSDSPVTSPVPFSLWSYNIKSQSWKEHTDPKFADSGEPVQRAAEGAGVSIPSLGRGYYFGGHQDYLTTAGWSISVARIYLQSLLEFTMPGFSNPSLGSGSPTGADGAYRNITVDSAGFPERADGALVYVPGYGKSGIILGLAGGTNQSFTQMNVIDVYDIEESQWYKQSTTGTTPGIRVNPCAVAASAADGSSTQVYMYGGQNLIPYGEQKQYDDIWILSIPSFAWIKVDTDGQSVPPARAGHTCNIWNGQMVVVGGYVGQDLSCDSPGVYIFNTTSLSWQNEYVAYDTKDALNRQDSQEEDPNALQGSFGYGVPDAVQSVIGGNVVGAATITAPAQSPSGGPMATGTAVTYTVTNADGSIATGPANPKNGEGNSGNSGARTGAIVAGVIAGVLFLVALYLAFCAWLYRRQFKVWKNHAAMAQRERLSPHGHMYNFLGVGGGKTSEKNANSSNGDDRFSSDNRSGSSNQANATRVESGRPEAGSSNGNANGGLGAGYATANSSTDDLMQGREPSFLGVFLNPRRSLRVVNRD